MYKKKDIYQFRKSSPSQLYNSWCIYQLEVCHRSLAAVVSMPAARDRST